MVTSCDELSPRGLVQLVWAMTDDGDLADALCL